MVELQLKRFYTSKPIQVVAHRLSELSSQLIEVGRSDRVLTVSVLSAVAVHVFFIFAITFSSGSNDKTTMQDIALAVSESKTVNPDADYLAQSNQQGAGVLRSAHRLTSPAQVQNQNQSIQAQTVTIQIIKEQQEEQTPSAEGERTVTTAASWKAESQSEKNRRLRKAQKQKESSSSTASMIATLEAQYATQKQEYSKISSIHTVDSVSTREDPSAVYMNQFRRKVEKIGNHNYPAEARSRHLKGDVRLMVILERDGSIRAIRLMQTSGSHLLDEAAKASVRQGAPYGRFDEAMKGYSQLHIIRTWRFSDENEMDVGM